MSPSFVSEQNLQIEVRASSEQVEFGMAFPLTVTLRWRQDLRVENWDEQTLSPLILELEKKERQEQGGHIQETRLYRAYLFQRESVSVPASVLKAKDEKTGEMFSASSSELTFTIQSALPTEVGKVELPGGPLEQPLPWKQWIGFSAAGLALLLITIWLWRKRKPKPRFEPTVPPMPPDLRALERLKRLRALSPSTAEEIQSFYVEASSLLREYIEERFALRAPEMTTEEFLNSSQTASALNSDQLLSLRQFLAHCDLVKFAKWASTAMDRSKSLDSAEKFIEETRSKHAQSSSSGSAFR